MSEIKIEKNIPIPNTVKNNRYPFKEMKVGDSIYVSWDKERYKSLANLQNAVTSAWRMYNSLNGADKAFTARRDETSSGIRIWRTK